MSNNANNVRKETFPGMGARFSAYCEKKEYSFRQLIRLTGVCHKTLSSIVNEDKISSGTLEKLSLHTDLNITWLVKGEGDMLSGGSSAVNNFWMERFFSEMNVGSQEERMLRYYFSLDKGLRQQISQTFLRFVQQLQSAPTDMNLPDILDSNEDA